MDFRDLVAAKLEKAAIPPRVLLSRFRFIDEQARYSRACLDPHYMPFYYHLGTHYPAKSLLDVGFGIGLTAACYFTGNPDTEFYLPFQESSAEYYSPRMGVANVKQVWRKPFAVHVGHVHDEAFIDRVRGRSWDLAVVNDRQGYDTHLLWLNTIWDVLSENGVICMDNVTAHDHARRAYRDFCIVRQREPYVFQTRYGVGLIAK